jgi:hypothetical protein
MEKVVANVLNLVDAANDDRGSATAALGFAESVVEGVVVVVLMIRIRACC